MLLDEEADTELEAEVELDELLLLLQPAARTVQPMVSRAAAVALFLARREIIPADCH